MTTRIDNTRRLRLTILALVLSVLACALPVPTTPADNTPAPTTQRLSSPPKPLTTPTTPETAVVNASEALHVRQEPGETALVIGYLRGGETVTLTGRCSGEPSGWAEIDWKQSVAWVNSDYLSKNKCSEDE